MKTASGIWKDQPEKHDFPAAQDYLSLLFEEKTARKLVASLRRAPTIRKMAKDLLRASALPVLDKDNPRVAADLKKLKRGEMLSPVLLVRGDGGKGLALIIADGYHRISASWHKDENILIACRIVSRLA